MFILGFRGGSDGIGIALKGSWRDKLDCRLFLWFIELFSEPTAF